MIGVHSDSGTLADFFEGMIDDVRIYDVALNAEQIQEVMGNPFVTEVWVDDDYTLGGDNDGHIWRYDAFNKIQDATNHTKTDAIIHVAAGTYIERVGLRNGNKLLGAGADVTIIDANELGCAVSAGFCDSSTIIDGFTITNGSEYSYTEGDTNYYYFGSGLFNYESDTQVHNCVFINNSSDRGGGGIQNLVSSSPTIKNCIFINNIATYNPWGVGSSGGGISHYSTSDITIINCAFIANSATLTGGAINIRSSGQVTLEGCTFIGNNGGDVLGTSYTSNYGDYVLKNSIYWYNNGWWNTACIVNHSNVEDCGGSGADWVFSSGSDGGGNIDSPPLFVDFDGLDNILGTKDDNLRLRYDSPCIDAGNNSLINSETDLDKRVRILDGNCDGLSIVDMGAYEYKPLGGDVNNDCVVDINDLIDMSEVFLEKNCSPCNGADLNFDGDVTLIDYSILGLDWLEDRRVP